MTNFVSRGGEKLQHAFTEFNVPVRDLICADFGASTGGFTDCLLQNGAQKVYSVEVGYGTVDWKIRNDPRVTVMERTNAMHVILPEKVDLIVADVGWTKQKLILPNIFANLKKGGRVISLIKPHYEAPKSYIVKGKLMEEKIDEILTLVKQDIENVGGEVLEMSKSPIVGGKGGNVEFLALIHPQ